MFSIADKTALVTGGAAGIGGAVVRRFVAAGAKVAFCGRSPESAFAVPEGATYFRADVAEEDQVAELMTQVHERLGPLDVLVNNADTWEFDAWLETTDAETYRRGFDVNAMGTIFCTKHVAPVMRDGGVIVNISSLSAEIAMPGYGSYSISKSALHGLTRTAAIELGDRGIRVIELCPGTVATEGMADEEGADAEIEAFNRLTPLRRVCEMDEVAATAHFLAADDYRYISGTSIRLDGAMTAGLSMGLCEMLLAPPEGGSGR